MTQDTLRAALDDLRLELNTLMTGRLSLVPDRAQRCLYWLGNIEAALAAAPQPDTAPAAQVAAQSQLERWEAEAEAFRKATGYLRPGKDYGALSGHHDEAGRTVAWKAWCGGRNWEAASPPEAAAVPVARFLLVSMDDDGCGTPVFCADEKAVREALAPLLFFFDEKHPLSAEHEAEVDAQCEALIEDGFLRFEGDPGINLYKLHAAPPHQAQGEPT